jgi:phospholipase/carboxylesterase
MRVVRTTAAAAVFGLAFWYLRTGSDVTRLEARPALPATFSPPGAHALAIDGASGGTLFIPSIGGSSTPLPLLVLFHGAGQRKELFDVLFPIADDLGIALLTIDSRGPTWDGIRDRFGPDVAVIDAALRQTFDRVAIDPRRLAIGGFSDGASYALGLGVMNGDLFTHIVAFSPGFIAQSAPPAGHPRIFVAHGTDDQILPIDRTSRQLVPQLERDGYVVTYLEFPGGHRASSEIARAGLAWLVDANAPS